VYKLVQVNAQPRIKVSQDSVKVTIPGRKEAYRLFNSAGEAVLDLLIASGTTPPVPQKRILCRHPFDANKRVYVTPSRVQALHSCWFDGGLTKPFPSLREIRTKVQHQLSTFREDHLRRLNPTPYKLSVTSGSSPTAQPDQLERAIFSLPSLFPRRVFCYCISSRVAHCVCLCVAATVCLCVDLFTFMHDLWLAETPIAEIR
jgi:hypothetical protein